jgi:hypothetical protein
MAQVIKKTLYENLNIHVSLWQAEVVADHVIEAQGDERAVLQTRRNAPGTSKAGVSAIRAGTAQERVLSAFMRDGRRVLGWTDDELESFTNRSHQSVSSVRNILMRKGYVADSGARRKTRSGNDAIVYVWTGKEPS